MEVLIDVTPLCYYWRSHSPCYTDYVQQHGSYLYSSRVDNDNQILTTICQQPLPPPETMKQEVQELTQWEWGKSPTGSGITHPVGWG